MMDGDQSNGLDVGDMIPFIPERNVYIGMYNIPFPNTIYLFKKNEY